MANLASLFGSRNSHGRNNNLMHYQSWLWTRNLFFSSGLTKHSLCYRVWWAATLSSLWVFCEVHIISVFYSWCNWTLSLLFETARDIFPSCFDLDGLLQACTQEHMYDFFTKKLHRLRAPFHETKIFCIMKIICFLSNTEIFCLQLCSHTLRDSFQHTNTQVSMESQTSRL